VNELHDTEKAQTMKFPHFLEAICRLGDSLDVPDDEMMDVFGVTDGFGYLFSPLLLLFCVMFSFAASNCLLFFL
jgi:hypothetical protein